MPVKKTTVDDKNPLSIWIQYKNYIYSFIIFMIGAIGGNVDRVPSIIRDVVPNDVPIEFEDLKPMHNRLLYLEKEVIRLDNRIDEVSKQTREELDGYNSTIEKKMNEMNAAFKPLRRSGE